MVAVFKKKCLVPNKRVCLRLKAAREAAGISLCQLETRTRIQKKYLQALEECRFDEVGQAFVYQKNFIKKYVQALGQNPESFLQQFTEEESTLKHACNKHPGVGCKKTHFSNLPNIIRFLLVGTAVLSVFIYLGNHIRHILQAPELSIISPSNGLITVENSVAVTGKTPPETKITINGEPIQNDEKGNFNQTIDLSPGINTLVITAQNKHGKTTEETMHVIYKTNKQFSLREQVDTSR